MLKFLALLTLLLQSISSPIPAPEILATPVPYFLDRATGDFRNPVALRATGHRGLDLTDMADQTVHAPFSGEVSYVGKVFFRNTLTIRSTSGLLATFEPICSNLKRGGWVAAGAEIGSYCLSDDRYQEHCKECVHFSIRSARGYLNPLLFYGRVKPGVLVS